MFSGTNKCLEMINWTAGQVGLVNWTTRKANWHENKYWRLIEQQSLPSGRKKANWDKRSAICSDASSIQCAISWKALYIHHCLVSLLRSHLSLLQISYLAPIRGSLLSFYQRSQTNKWKWPACVKKRCKFSCVFTGTEAKFPSSLKRKILRRYCLKYFKSTYFGDRVQIILEQSVSSLQSSCLRY